MRINGIALAVVLGLTSLGACSKDGSKAKEQPRTATPTADHPVPGAPADSPEAVAAVDAVLFPHTCDAIQGLASLAPDLGGWTKPALRFLHPKGESRPSARTFLCAELEALAQRLAEISGRTYDPDRLRWALELHRQINERRRQLLDERRLFPGSNTELYALLRRGEFLWPEDHLVELTQHPFEVGDLDLELRHACFHACRIAQTRRLRQTGGRCHDEAPEGPREGLIEILPGQGGECG